MMLGGAHQRGGQPTPVPPAIAVAKLPVGVVDAVRCCCHRRQGSPTPWHALVDLSGGRQTVRVHVLSAFGSLSASKLLTTISRSSTSCQRTNEGSSASTWPSDHCRGGRLRRPARRRQAASSPGFVARLKLARRARKTRRRPLHRLRRRRSRRGRRRAPPLPAAPQQRARPAVCRNIVCAGRVAARGRRARLAERARGGKPRGRTWLEEAEASSSHSRSCRPRRPPTPSPRRRPHPKRAEERFVERAASSSRRSTSQKARRTVLGGAAPARQARCSGAETFGRRAAEPTVDRRRGVRSRRSAEGRRAAYASAATSPPAPAARAGLQDSRGRSGRSAGEGVDGGRVRTAYSELVGDGAVEVSARGSSTDDPKFVRQGETAAPREPRRSASSSPWT